MRAASLGKGRLIYTLALNPAIDRTFWIGRLEFGETNRVGKECRYAGGKGIDVSRVLTNLGVPNKALGFCGGFAGEELECRLINEGVFCEFIRISGETRTNIIVNENDGERQLLLSTSGPEVSPYELGELLKKIDGIEDASLLALGGSLPAGVNPQTYRRIIQKMKEKGTVTLLDADGDALKVGIEASPDYIKPNKRELGGLVGRELQDIEDVLNAAEEARELGASTVLVSMGADGIMLVGEGKRYWAVPPKVKAVNSVGVGDSAVAGFIYGLAKGLEEQGCLVHAAAAGTATALKPGTARAGKKDVLDMVPRIELRDISKEVVLSTPGR